MTVVLITIGIIAVFAFIESLYAIGIMAESNISLKKKKERYSVVIAARNEEKFIQTCIASLLKQSMPPAAIIVVDDHSDDQTLSVVRAIAAENPLLVVLSCDAAETGKRAAIMKGIVAAETDIILTTDADCIARQDWAATMISKFSENKKLVSGPVITKTKVFQNPGEYAESLFLMATGAGAATQGLMFQASGANMVFLKSDFMDFYKSASGAGFSCGDDVFFLQFIQKKYGRKSTGFCSNAGAVVETHPSAGMKSWILQRVRWAAKSRGYSDVLPFLTGALVAISNIALVAALILFMLLPELRFFIIPGILLKIMGDVLVLFSAAFSWNAPVRIISFFLLPVLYPLFLMTVGIAMMLHKNKTWKGRTIS